MSKTADVHSVVHKQITPIHLKFQFTYMHIFPRKE